MLSCLSRTRTGRFPSLAPIFAHPSALRPIRRNVTSIHSLGTHIPCCNASWRLAMAISQREIAACLQPVSAYPRLGFIRLSEMHCDSSFIRLCPRIFLFNGCSGSHDSGAGNRAYHSIVKTCSMNSIKSSIESKIVGNRLHSTLDILRLKVQMLRTKHNWKWPLKRLKWTWVRGLVHFCVIYILTRGQGLTMVF